MVKPKFLRWDFPKDEPIPAEILEQVGGNHIIAQALVSRGFKTRSQVIGFLDPNHYLPANPFNFQDMDIAVKRIRRAIERKESIGIWGDFDVDGQTATTLLVETLVSLGSNVSYHVPVRGPESHGIDKKVLASFLKSEIKLLLTCDTGISAWDSIDYCNENEVDVIITDHHSIPDRLPKALALINPGFLPADHPLSKLSGVGVAYQLSRALLDSSDLSSKYDELLELVALGTVADVADLRMEGHYLTQRGIQQLKRSKRIGLSSLSKLAGLDLTNINEDHIRFVIAPRLNAVGRLSDANDMISFLTTSDHQFAEVFAQQIESINSQRKILVDQVFQAAMKQIEADRERDNSPLIFLAHPAWPAPVVGIVASRLVEKFQKPVFIFNAPSEGKATGSARSVEGVNIISEITKNSENLISFGGHPMAAGLSLPTENLPVLRRSLEKSISQSRGPEPFENELVIAGDLPFSGISLDLAAQIDQLAPFGPGNPPLVFIARDVEIINKKTLGREKDHLEIRMTSDDEYKQRVLFWHGSDAQLPEGKFDLAYSIRASDFRGSKELTLELVDFRQQDEPVLEMKPPKKIEIIDHRHDPDQEPYIENLAGQNDTEIFLEGFLSVKFPRKDRFSIEKSKILIIAAAPSSQAIFQDVIERSKPETIILCAISNLHDDMSTFLSGLMGLVKYSLNNKNGEYDSARFAAALSQRTETVEKGMELLVNQGSFKLVGEKITLNEEKGPLPKSSIEKTENALKNMLKETASYRQYFQRVDPDTLLESIQNHKGKSTLRK